MEVAVVRASRGCYYAGLHLKAGKLQLRQRMVVTPCAASNTRDREFQLRPKATGSEREGPRPHESGTGKFVLERRCQHPDATEIITRELAARELRKIVLDQWASATVHIDLQRLVRPAVLLRRPRWSCEYRVPAENKKTAMLSHWVAIAARRAMANDHRQQ